MEICGLILSHRYELMLRWMLYCDVNSEYVIVWTCYV
jgi:hypothetical protein